MGRPPADQRGVARAERNPPGELTRQDGNLRIAHQLDEPPAAALELLRQLEEVARALVHEDDAAREIGDQHPFEHASQDRLEPLVLDPKLGDGGRHVACHDAELGLQDSQLVAALGNQVWGRLAVGQPPGEGDEAVDASQHATREDQRGGEPEGGGRHDAGHEQAA